MTGVDAKALEAAIAAYVHADGVGNVHLVRRPLDAQMEAAIRAYIAVANEAGVTVKPLEWRARVGTALWEADSPIGFYTCSFSGWSRDGFWHDDPRGPVAAQADHEQRIRSALTPASAVAEPREPSEGTGRPTDDYALGLLLNTAEAICKKLESETATVTILDQSALRQAIDGYRAMRPAAPQPDTKGER